MTGLTEVFGFAFLIILGIFLVIVMGISSVSAFIGSTIENSFSEKHPEPVYCTEGFYTCKQKLEETKKYVCYLCSQNGPFSKECLRCQWGSPSMCTEINSECTLIW